MNPVNQPSAHSRSTVRIIARFWRGLVVLALSAGFVSAHGFDVLIFTKTAGFAHSSIPTGTTAIQQLGVAHDFGTTVTNDAATFISQLPNHDVVMFLNTTGDVLDPAQQAAFEAWYKSGKGFVGIHSAADTEHTWPWYLDLVGARFSNHPAIAPATVKFLDQVHPITNVIDPATSQRVTSWSPTDEWYNFTTSPRGKVHVLGIVDDTTYTGGTHEGDHPITWCREFDGGRTAYLSMGHGNAIYADPIFRGLITNTIEWTAGKTGGDSGATIDANYQKDILIDNLSQGIAMDIDAAGNVYVIERSSGRLKKFDPSTNATTTLATIPVYSGGEFGLLGIALAPDFAATGNLYLIYSPPATGADQRLSRFTLTTGGVTNERVLLEHPVLRPDTPGVGLNPRGHHQGGCLRFDTTGNLLLSIGDNTDASNYSPRSDTQPIKDARKSAANTNDLRGGIIRITPSVGTGPPAHPNYTIPSGNLFPSPTIKQRGEIYVMGARNPFRFCVDPYTNWLYFGDVGPDALDPGTAAYQGPEGHDEFNQVRQAGNFGWPYFIGFGKAYRDGSGATWTPATIATDLTTYFSANSITADTTLLAAKPPWIAYTYKDHLGFPEMRTIAVGTRNSRAAMAGSVYQWQPGAGSGAFPRYHDKTVFLMDYSRKIIGEAKRDAAGNLFDLKRFLPNLAIGALIDMKFGPDGEMYYLEYDTGDLVKIRYVAGSLQPVAMAAANVTSGPAPLSVQFSSAGSVNPLGSTGLTFSWNFGDGSPVISNPNPLHVFTVPGTFNVQLTVTDSFGGTSVTNLTISSGNSAPTVSFNFPANNTFYDPGDTVGYAIQVSDAEDGSTAGGQITGADVLFEASLGHAEHQHNELQFNSLAKDILIPRDTGHDFDANLYYVFDALYTDKGAPGVLPIQSQATSRLRTKVQMAQFFDQASGVTILPTTDPVGGVEEIAAVNDGDWIMFSKLNLSGINAIRLRAASTHGGSVQIRTDSPAGALLGTITVSATGNNITFRDFTVPITDPGSAHDFYLIFKNPANPSDILRLNWISFRGQGVTLTPERPLITGATMIGDNRLRLTFDQVMDLATLQNSGNYRIANTVGALTATAEANQRGVILQTQGLLPNAYYQLQVSGCEDLAGDLMTPREITVLNRPNLEPFFLGINCGGPQHIDSSGRVWNGEVASITPGRLLGFDFNRDSNSILHTGAAVIGSTGNAWNGTHLAASWSSVTIPALVNSAGNSTALSATLASFSASGAPLNAQRFVQTSSIDPDIATSCYNLTRDYAYQSNSGAGQSNQGSYFLLNISGLAANSVHDLYLYGSGDTVGQGAKFTVNGVSKTTVNTSASRTAPVSGQDYVLFSSANAGAGGTIVARVENNGSHPDFNLAGFQLNTPGTANPIVNYYNTGTSVTTKTAAIANTVEDKLYQSERWKAGPINYSIPVQNGLYDVTLKFAEIHFTAPGMRAFNVSIEGGPELFIPKLDLYAVAGANTAHDRVVSKIPVSDGVLNIEFTQPGPNNPKIAAISVERPTVAPIPNPSFAAFAGGIYQTPVSLADDTDQDGLNLLLEYALGLSPMIPDAASGLPVLAAAAGGADFDFSFERPEDLPDVTYQIMASGQLGTWVPLPVTPVVTPASPGMEHVRFPGVIAAASTAGIATGKRCYFRLAVELTGIPE